MEMTLTGSSSPRVSTTTAAELKGGGVLEHSPVPFSSALTEKNQ